MNSLPTTLFPPRRLLIVAALSFAALFGERAQAISIDVGTATGRPGENVSFEVRISAVGDNNVVALENKIQFHADTAISADSLDDPDCRLADSVDKEFFPNYQDFPTGCTAGVDCEQIKAIVGRFNPGDPSALDPLCFSDECLLYTCEVSIADDAVVGAYPLVCSDPILSDRDGQRFPDTTCTNGTVFVVSTPPATPTPPDPPSFGERYESLLHDGAEIEGGGCQIGRTPRSASAWMLLLPLLLFVRRRGR